MQKLVMFVMSTAARSAEMEVSAGGTRRSGGSPRGANGRAGPAAGARPEVGWDLLLVSSVRKRKTSKWMSFLVSDTVENLSPQASVGSGAERELKVVSACADIAP